MTFNSSENIGFPINDSLLPKTDKNYGWKMKTDLGAIFNGKNLSNKYVFDSQKYC